MNSDRLWPVLLVLLTILLGVGALEWIAENREETYEVVRVFDNSGAEGETSGRREAPWQSSDPVNAEHVRARQLLRRGELEPALEEYQQLLASNQATVPLLAEYAYALRRTERCEEARVLLERALLLAPDDAFIQLSAAYTYQCLGDVEAARAAFEETLRIDPDQLDTMLAFGEFLLSQGELSRAISVLLPATRTGTNEERAAALAAYGRAVFRRGDRRTAQEALGEAVERAPSRVAIWMSVARTYLLSEEPLYLNLALEHAQQATRLAPELATAFSALGRAHEKLGQKLEAIDAYSRAATLDPEYEYVRVRLIRLALEEEEHAMALTTSRQLIGIDADNDEYQYLLGRSAAANEEMDMARAAFRAAIRLRDGNYPEAWYELGTLERSVERPRNAEMAFQMAVAANPSFDDAWLELGNLAFAESQYEAARSAYDVAIALDPMSAEAWTGLARTMSELADNAAAVRAFTRALEISPGNRMNRLRLGAAYRRAGRADEAIRLYQRLVADEPLFVSAWFNLGIALGADGRDVEAIAAYERALSIDPNHLNSMKNLGLLQAKLGLNDAALRHLTDALDREPNDHDVRVLIAELALATGDIERCRREVTLVLSQVPDNDSALALGADCRGSR